MVSMVMFGVVVGGLTTLMLRRRDARARQRQARSRERVAAIVLYEEVKAAIDAIDFALQEQSSRWLESMSESATLTEAWREQAEALMALEPDRWCVLSDAVAALAPGHRPDSGRAHAEDVRRTLVEHRELLVRSAGILLDIRDRRPHLSPCGLDRAPSLLV